MTFTIEIPLLGPMFLEVSGEWTPASPQGDVAEITIIDSIIPIVRGRQSLGGVYNCPEISQGANIIMENDQEFNERVIDALEERDGY